MLINENKNQVLDFDVKRVIKKQIVGTDVIIVLKSYIKTILKDKT